MPLPHGAARAPELPIEVAALQRLGLLVTSPLRWRTTLSAVPKSIAANSGQWFWAQIMLLRWFSSAMSHHLLSCLQYRFLPLKHNHCPVSTYAPKQFQDAILKSHGCKGPWEVSSPPLVPWRGCCTITNLEHISTLSYGSLKANTTSFGSRS